MPKRTWNEETAKERIKARIADVKSVTIKDYVRTMSLEDIPTGVAYRVDGVHLYIDILNIDDMLNSTVAEGETCHKRTLRFLNQHYRAVRNILQDVEAIEVDFHNQRLHAVFAKPYDDEKARIHKAVATAQLICNVLKKTGDDGSDPLPAAKTRVGIDSGKALAVNNGRRSSREPLFLGNPANQAAKRAGGGDDEGIFMTNDARKVVGWDKVLEVDATALTAAQIKESEDSADLPVTVDEVVEQWKKDLASNPIGTFSFSRHTPPFRTIDLELLTPGNSRRQESTSIYSDIDNFTKYVAARVGDDEESKDVVRTLHVLRSELDSVLYSDFEGIKVRFIGDCIHGILVEGTSLTTDDEETAKNALLCAAAMRSSFNLAIGEMKSENIDTGDLGLAIGLEHGIMSVTRLGMKGERVRCCISRSVLASENEQLRCNGRQTAVGSKLYDFAPKAFQALFGKSRYRSDFDYAVADEALNPKAEPQKSTGTGASLLHSTTSVSAAAGFAFNKAAAQPSRNTGGFS